MTIEEKAKAYDEALAKAVKIHRNYKGRVRAVDVVIEEVFPELKESEDERIMKAILNYFIKCWGNSQDDVCGVHVEDVIAWLEKQGKKEYALKSFKDEDVRKFMQCIKKQAKAYEFNLPNRGYDIYAFAKDLLVWLEKQGEQKPIIEMKSAEESLGIDSDTYNKIVDECIYGEQKHADKVEPKFKVGDWIVHNDNGCICQITSIREDDYCLWPLDSAVEGYLEITDIDNKYHLWTIQDAKDGDVLACENGWTCIFKTLVNDETFSSYCFMDNTKWFCETGSEAHTLKEEFVKAYNGKIHPATKEQRDNLFANMKKAGYKWDAEKKELRKIEQNNDWSEEDEQYFNFLEKLLNNLQIKSTENEIKKGTNSNSEYYFKVIQWLKSLKERYN